MSGVGCGLSYMIPMQCVWEFYPEKKGLVTGILMSAYGLGSFFYTLISTALVNPNSESPSVESGVKDLKYFSKDIADRTPYMI